MTSPFKRFVNCDLSTLHKLTSLGIIHGFYTYLNLFNSLQVIAAMTGGGVDRSLECTGSISAMISAFECVHDVKFLKLIF